jgi:hypothetical protein
MKLFAAIFFILLLVGCSKARWISEDPKIAAQQIETLIPFGTSKEDAEKILGKAGIKPRRLNMQMNQGPVFDYALQGDFIEDGFITKKRWVITVFLKDDRASTYEVRLEKK